MTKERMQSAPCGANLGTRRFRRAGLDGKPIGDPQRAQSQSTNEQYKQGAFGSAGFESIRLLPGQRAGSDAYPGISRGDLYG